MEKVVVEIGEGWFGEKVMGTEGRLGWRSIDSDV